MALLQLPMLSIGYGVMRTLPVCGHELQGYSAIIASTPQTKGTIHPPGVGLVLIDTPSVLGPTVARVECLTAV